MKGSGTVRTWAWGGGLLAALTAFAIFAVTGTSWFSPVDPRAYPGSQRGTSLEKALAKYGLDLPACPVEGLGFSANLGAGQYFSLGFKAPLTCVDEFLSAHGVDDQKNPPSTWPRWGGGVIGGREISPYDLPFSSESMARYGWVLDRTKKYDIHRGFHTGKKATFDVLVDRAPEVRTVYMNSSYSGGN